jgi:hypothetical protein
LDGTLNGAFGWNSEPLDGGPGLGLILENLGIGNFFNFGFAQTSSQGPDPCNAVARRAPSALISVDGSLVMTYAVHVPKFNRSVTVSFPQPKHSDAVS